MSKSESHRKIVAAFAGIPTSDGAGVKLERVIGQPGLPDLDPFLLFDAFGSDDPGAYIAGFPDHPHRGFETVTYMLEGRMRHRDSRGNEGLLTAGSVQWMTAGSGLLHSEMPEQEEGRMAGFQLWVNLPAKDKMTAPRYQDIAPDNVPVVQVGDGVTAKLLAGTLNGVTGPVDPGATQPFYADLAFVAGGGRAVVPLTPGHNAFVYVFEGAASVGGTALPRGRIGVLGDGDDVVVEASGPARVLVVAGKPLREPVARYGPFVMNTRAEIQQAFADFQAGLFN
jgi:redox-sensitive bicupin YhaK (pirin superfamily)